MGNSASARIDPGELGRELAALERIKACTVERVLKQGPPETTELVREPAEGTGAGTLRIRKTFEGDGGVGVAYETLARAQAAGAVCTRLPRVRACAQVGETRFVLLDYVEGETLQALVEGVGPLPAERALDVAIEICRAAEELHALPAGPLIHRDIKPSNVIVRGEDVTLIDLGIARVRRPGAERDTVRFGTPGFAPPEQYGYGQTSVESDVYAIGMVLAFCLLGKVPGQEERANGFAGLPAGLRPLVARAASFDPADRYPTAAAFRRDLENVFVARDEREVGDAQHARDFSDARKASEPPSRSAPAPADRPADSSSSPEPAPADQPPDSFPRRRPDSGSLGLRGRLRAWCARPAARRVGRAWNVVLLVWLAFSLAISVGIVVDPSTEADRALPLAARAVEYLGIMGPVQILLLLPFAYKGFRRSAFPLVGGVSWPRGLARSWGLAALCLVATFVLVELLAPGTVVASG
jgi:serine/threonine protein kinase